MKDIRKKQIIGKATIPKSVGEIIHIDIFHADNQLYLSCLDKYSKFAIFVNLPNKLNMTVNVETILQMFPFCTHIMTDNESIFTSHVMENLFQRYNVTHVLAPAAHSTSNGQVERLHSTIMEIARCLVQEKNDSFENIIFEAIRAYNCTIHSVTKQKPIDIFYNQNDYPDTEKLLKEAREKMLNFHNKNRTEKKFEVGQEIFVKGNRRNKKTPRYAKHYVEEDKKNTVQTKKKGVVHKDLIRK